MAENNRPIYRTAILICAMLMVQTLVYAQKRTKCKVEAGDLGPLTEYESFFGLKLLNEELDSVRVFLQGETHEVQGNFSVHLKLLRYLHSAFGVRYLVLETGAAEARLVNEYLATGDTSYLRSVLNRHSFPDDLSAWDSLRIWNASLPEFLQVSCLGIDHEHPDAIWQVLPLLMPSMYEQAPHNVRATLAELQGHLRNHSELADSKRIRALHRFLPHLEERLRQNETDLRFFLGDKDYETLIRIAGNDAASNQDRYLALNMERHEAKLDSTARFFVVCGTDHLRKTWNPGPEFGWFLNNSEPFQGKVFASAMVYEDVIYLDEEGKREEVNQGPFARRYYDRRRSCVLSKSGGQATLIIPDEETRYWNRITKRYDAMIVVRNQSVVMTDGNSSNLDSSADCGCD